MKISEELQEVLDISAKLDAVMFESYRAHVLAHARQLEAEIIGGIDGMLVNGEPPRETPPIVDQFGRRASFFDDKDIS